RRSSDLGTKLSPLLAALLQHRRRIAPRVGIAVKLGAHASRVLFSASRQNPCHKFPKTTNGLTKVGARRPNLHAGRVRSQLQSFTFARRLRCRAFPSLVSKRVRSNRTKPAASCAQLRCRLSTPDNFQKNVRNERLVQTDNCRDNWAAIRRRQLPA